MGSLNNLGETMYFKINPYLNQSISTWNLSVGTHYLNFKDKRGVLHNKLFIKQ